MVFSYSGSDNYPHTMTAYCHSTVQGEIHCGVMIANRNIWRARGYPAHHACQTANSPEACVMASELQLIVPVVREVTLHISPRAIRFVFTSPGAQQLFEQWRRGNTTLPSWYRVSHKDKIRSCANLVAAYPKWFNAEGIAPEASPFAATCEQVLAKLHQYTSQPGKSSRCESEVRDLLGLLP